MKWEEIERQFDNEWVLIEVTKIADETFEVLEGEVLFHSSDKEKIYEKLQELQPKGFAIRYIGEIPEDLVIML